MWMRATGVRDEDRLDAAQTRRTLRRTARRLRPQSRQVAGALAMVLLWTGTVLAGPYLVRVGIDDGIKDRDAGTLNAAVVGYIVASVLAYVTNRLQIGLISRAGERFLRDLRISVFAHLQRLSMPYYDRTQAGVIVSRMTSDIDSLSELVQMGLAMFVSNSLLLAVSLVVLASVSWKLLLVCVVALPPVILASIKFHRASNVAYLDVRDRIGATLSHLQEGIAGVRVVQAFAREDVEADRFRRRNQALYGSHMRSVRVSAWYMPVIELAGLGTTALALGVGGWWVHEEWLTVGTVAFFVLTLSNLFEPVFQLSQLFNIVQAAGAALHKLYDLLDTSVDVTERPGAVDLPVHGDIEVDHVSFAYAVSTVSTDGADGAGPGSSDGSGPSSPGSGDGRRMSRSGPVVLRDVSLRIPVGSRLALVGPTGAGKSTLAKLAVRFADPDAGVIRIDGHDARDVTLRSLRDHVALLLQDAPLFDGTVRDNVAYNRPDATDADVRAALADAAAAGLADELPHGLSTRTGQRGRALSGGQRRRVAMARALLQDAPVLVLDEPSAGLDAASTARLLTPLRRLMRDRATLLITHDLELAAAADEVVVLDHGRVVERGAPSELAWELLAA